MDAKIKLGELGYRMAQAVIAHQSDGTLERYGEARLAIAEYQAEKDAQAKA